MVQYRGREGAEVHGRVEKDRRISVLKPQDKKMEKETGNASVVPKVAVGLTD